MYDQNNTANLFIIRVIVLLSFLCFNALWICPVNAQERQTFRVMFWNVENLFDCRHDSLKNDQEYLPNSIRAWTVNRYKKKLANISRVITAVGEWEPPALVGLCEVENDNVMRDLTRYSPLKEHAYRYVMTDSPDPRGIDVALMYQRDEFKLIQHQSIRVYLDDDKRYTRDILHCSGIVHTMDTLDVFVIHFPSRSDGEKETEKYRITAARTLRNAVDSIYAIRTNSQILIMGDFNDYPTNKSISSVLNAKAPEHPIERNKLYNLLARKAEQKNYGSYKYREKWGLFDQIIVSGTLLNPIYSMFTSEENAGVVRLPFLLEKDDKFGGEKLFRTYYGMKYLGGYSDHLPVYLDFMINTSY